MFVCGYLSLVCECIVEYVLVVCSDDSSALASTLKYVVCDVFVFGYLYM